MITGKISARYAKALYKFAEERKQEESIYNEMKIVANSFFEVPELKEALANPTLTAQKKERFAYHSCRYPSMCRIQAFCGFGRRA